MKDIQKIFKQSYRRIIDADVHMSEFTEVFYRKFLGSSEEVRSKFMRTDLRRQRKMLADSFCHMNRIFEECTVTDRIAEIARIHQKDAHDIPEHLYELWLDALVYAVGEIDPDFNPSVELAWRMAMSPGIRFMTFCYDQEIDWLRYVDD